MLSSQHFDLRNYGQIGANGGIVEMDESKFKRSRWQNAQSRLGLWDHWTWANRIERGQTGRFIMISVQKSANNKTFNSTMGVSRMFCYHHWRVGTTQGTSKKDSGLLTLLSIIVRDLLIQKQKESIMSEEMHWEDSTERRTDFKITWMRLLGLLEKNQI